MVSSGEDPDAFASGELHKKQSPDNGKHTIQQIDDTGIDKSQIPEEVTPVKSEKSLQDPVVGLHISKLDKEGSISSITSGKVPQTPGTISSALQSGQSGRSPIIREKVSEDGYHWRKYGQKLVKGNEFIRSYYKCTHPSCLVKKQLERSQDGKISDIVYFGHHDHPKPELHLPQTVGLVLPVEEKADEPLSIGKGEACSPHQLKSSTTSQISTVASNEDVKDVLPESNRIRDEVHDDDMVPSKRQKKSIQNIESTHVDKLTASEPRVVLQTLSEVDIVNDGYRWRKYGQKTVKGNPNPRSYYRCSSPGCPVKKHVERASHDPKVVITSYEGQHDHNMPPSRTITQNASGLNHNGDSGSKPEPTDVVEAKSLSPCGNSNEQLNSSLTGKPKAGDICGSDAATFSNEIQDRKSNAAEGNNATGTGSVVNSSSVSKGRSDEQNDDELRTEMKVNCTACSAQTITPGLESNPNEQHIKNAEPVQS
ncbi:WRKY transcription factor 1 [Euphorbia lathyris]|uniref:WRKY transcription factor 1 n=1 Tax=Euphorbia lathyris TaxID=212925 RepID=UPI0033137733